MEGLLTELDATPVTHVLLNAGHWGHDALTEEHWAAVARAGARLMRPRPGVRSKGARVFWRTTPRHAAGPVSMGAPMGALGHVPWASTRDVNTHAFVQAGWEIYDAAASSRATSAMGIPTTRPATIASLWTMCICCPIWPCACPARGGI